MKGRVQDIQIVVAMSENRGIGQQGKLPWHLPADLKHFKALTMGKPIVMGRKTYESIGRALPGRRNIILSRRADFSPEGCEVATSVDAVLAATQNEPVVCVIGGAEVYQLFLSRAEEIWLTLVHVTLDADAYFPPLDDAWQQIHREDHKRDDKNPFDYSFIRLKRRSRI